MQVVSGVKANKAIADLRSLIISSSFDDKYFFAYLHKWLKQTDNEHFKRKHVKGGKTMVWETLSVEPRPHQQHNKIKFTPEGIHEFFFWYYQNDIHFRGLTDLTASILFSCLISSTKSCNLTRYSSELFSLRSFERLSWHQARQGPVLYDLRPSSTCWQTWNTLTSTKFCKKYI